jgi:hypothetical protein
LRMCFNKIKIKEEEKEELKGRSKRAFRRPCGG